MRQERSEVISERAINHAIFSNGKTMDRTENRIVAVASIKVNTNTTLRRIPKQPPIAPMTKISIRTEFLIWSGVTPTAFNIANSLRRSLTFIIIIVEIISNEKEEARRITMSIT